MQQVVSHTRAPRFRNPPLVGALTACFWRVLVLGLAGSRASDKLFAGGAPSWHPSCRRPSQAKPAHAAGQADRRAERTKAPRELTHAQRGWEWRANGSIGCGGWCLTIWGWKLEAERVETAGLTGKSSFDGCV